MLTFLIVLPVGFGLFLLLQNKVHQIKVFSLGFSLFYLSLVLSLFFFFDPHVSRFQMVQQVPWISYLGISYFVGVDGLSFWLVLLTGLLCPISVLASWNLIQTYVKGFYICLFLMTAFVMGTFLSLDGILFYVFFEASLIPLYFLIGLWGGKLRLQAALKFFVYTALGSLFLLAGVVSLMILVKHSTGHFSASVSDFYQLFIPFQEGEFFNLQNMLFFCFLLAFAIKLPLVPFHTWLPLAHVQAPAPASAWLAALVLKMGAYGLFRFVLPLFPQSVESFSPVMIIFSGLAVLYGAFMALSQTDMKKIVAYSSVSHMAFVCLGVFSLHIYALTGAFYQMISHALSSAALFLLVGMIYERTKSLKISDYGGLSKTMPLAACFFVIFSLSVMAFPSTGAFVSEFLIFTGAFQEMGFKALMFPLWGVVLGAVYMLYFIHRVFFGSLSPVCVPCKKLSLREKVVLVPFVVGVFFTGLFPQTLLKYSSPFLSQVKQRYSLPLKKQESKPFKPLTGD